jgi:hypothetical protein
MLKELDEMGFTRPNLLTIESSPEFLPDLSTNTFNTTISIHWKQMFLNVTFGNGVSHVPFLLSSPLPFFESQHMWLMQWKTLWWVSTELFACIRSREDSSQTQALLKNGVSPPQGRTDQLMMNWSLNLIHKKTPWPLVRKRTIPTEQPPHVGEVSANFAACRRS